MHIIGLFGAMLLLAANAFTCDWLRVNPDRSYDTLVLAAMMFVDAIYLVLLANLFKTGTK